jgi:hypothetical protein
MAEFRDHTNSMSGEGMPDQKRTTSGEGVPMYLIGEGPPV